MFQNKYTRDNLAEVLRSYGINPTHQRIEHFEHAPTFLLLKRKGLGSTHALRAVLLPVAHRLLERFQRRLELLERVRREPALA